MVKLAGPLFSLVFLLACTVPTPQIESSAKIESNGAILVCSKETPCASMKTAPDELDQQEELRKAMLTEEKGCLHPKYIGTVSYGIECLTGLPPNGSFFEVVGRWYLCEDGRKVVSLELEPEEDMGPCPTSETPEKYAAVLEATPPTFDIFGGAHTCVNPELLGTSGPAARCYLGQMQSMTIRWWKCPGGRVYVTLDKHGAPAGPCPMETEQQFKERLERGPWK